MTEKKKNAKMANAKKSLKRGSVASAIAMTNDAPYKFDDWEDLSCVLSDAEQCISEYEDVLHDGEVTPEATDALVSDMNCIRDRLEDFADDGWEGYRNAIEEFSNRLWLLRVAWPQYLPPWHVADTVDPADIGKDIRMAWIYEDDFFAIRKMSDDQKMNFKDMVKELVELGRHKYGKTK